MFTSNWPTLFQNGGPAASAPRGQQYNNPSALYSEESIKEVLNQQAETLASGVKGWGVLWWFLGCEKNEIKLILLSRFCDEKKAQVSLAIRGGYIPEKLRSPNTKTYF